LKRLLTLMLACGAIVVLGVAAAAVRAEDGSDDGARSCDVRHENEAGDDHGTDSRAVASEDRDGTSGDDDERGTSGDDDIQGHSGNDTINSRDGQRDVVTCGRGRDRVRADRKDRVARGCESVKRS
jgi:hypothetical protein